MKTRKDWNREYYEKNKEKEKERSLAHYHANKEKIDREKKREYMAEYLKTYQRRKPTAEEKMERARLRREKYEKDAEHREKVKAQARKYNAKNPEVKKANRFKQEFSITLDQYNAMLESQGGRCAICGAEKTGVKESKKRERSLSVDHCHGTGNVRGLLCHNCNLGLGHFQDNPELLRKAIGYLNKS